jgi:hypothetical protein
MAKGDKTDVAKAKRAVSKKGLHGPYGATTKQVNAERKMDAKKSGYSQPKAAKGSDGFKMIGKSISAKKPSVAVKTGAKNKMKAQGAKIGSSATSGYGKTTKK